jgi:hypothetical protein
MSLAAPSLAVLQLCQVAFGRVASEAFLAQQELFTFFFDY